MLMLEGAGVWRRWSGSLRPTTDDSATSYTASIASRARRKQAVAVARRSCGSQVVAAFEKHPVLWVSFHSKILMLTAALHHK